MGQVLKHSVVHTEGCSVYDVLCGGYPSRSWSDPEECAGYGLVFVRRGSFIRRVAEAESLMDSSVAYFETPGQEQRVAHPHRGDRCTALSMSASFITSMWGDLAGLPEAPVFIGSRTNLIHRLLLTTRDRAVASDHLVRLVSSVMREADARRVVARRPATARARRRAVDEARDVLHRDSNLGLVELSRRIAVSPHHLSRIFSEVTGQTLTRYRLGLRISAALDHLEDGSRDLASIAQDVGFADHAHMTRSIRRELGHTPSVVRRLLRGQASPRRTN
jgi:AraC-like DNA-binding protein